MGTRHLICVVIDGDFKIAQYGQWDGYPDGQGIDILTYLRTANYDALTANLRKLRWTTHEDFARVNKELDLGDSGWMDMEQAARYKAAYPALSRDTGSKILALVEAGGVEFVTDSRDFAQDSLFCEWGYVIDLDTKVLEVYEGFVESTPTEGRWAGQHKAGEQYAAIKRIASFPFADGLPTDDEFVKEVVAASRYPEDGDEA